MRFAKKYPVPHHPNLQKRVYVKTLDPVRDSVKVRMVRKAEGRPL